MGFFDFFRKKKPGQNAAGNRDGQASPRLEFRFYFENRAEFVAFRTQFGENRVVWQKGDAYLERYRKGCRFMAEGRFRWAIQMLRGSLCLNPVGISARFALCECCLQLRELSTARRTLNEMSAWLTAPAEIARFYREMGRVERERGSELGAAACYVYSRKFEDDPAIRGELEHIRAKVGSGADQVLRDPVPVLRARNIAVLHFE